MLVSGSEMLASGSDMLASGNEMLAPKSEKLDSDPQKHAHLQTLTTTNKQPLTRKYPRNWL